MKKVYKKLLLLICVVLAVSGCDYKSSSLGSDRRIFVFADSLVWLDIKEDFKETFHAYVNTPRAEKSFIIQHKPLSTLSGFKGRKNIFFIGTTDKQTEVNKYISQIVPIQFRNDVNNDKSFYFFKDDLFMREQLSLFMIAKDTKSLLFNFKNFKRDIFNRFNEKYFARLKLGMFEKGEQIELEEFLKKNFGYYVKVQHDYFIANQELNEKYVWIRRINPDRWISIWKVDNTKVDFSQDNLFEIRNKMSKKYYEGDYIVKEETFVSNQMFQGEETLKITGIWRNDSVLVGGPFRTYLIPNEKEKSIYFLDIAVMAPSKDKKPLLDQLEVIANTFQFVSEKNKKINIGEI